MLHTKPTAQRCAYGPPPPSANTGRTYMATTAPMTRSCPSTLFILFMFPSPGYVRIDKTSLTSRGERIAKSMPIRRGIAGGSRFRPTGWIHKGVWVAGETVPIPTSAICLHMDRDSSSIERDACPCLAAMETQRLPGLHISMCSAHGRVQRVVKHVHEEASFLPAHNFREDWLQRERQGVGMGTPARWRTD